MTPEKVARMSSLLSEGMFSDVEVASQMADTFMTWRSQLTGRIYDLLNAAPSSVLRELAKEIAKCDPNDGYYKLISEMIKSGIARREGAHEAP